MVRKKAGKFCVIFFIFIYFVCASSAFGSERTVFPLVAVAELVHQADELYFDVMCDGSFFKHSP